jgi:hypothetical protein
MDTELPSISELSTPGTPANQLLGLFVESFISLEWAQDLIKPFGRQQQECIQGSCGTVVSEGKSEITQELARDLGCNLDKLTRFSKGQANRLRTVCYLIKGRQDLHYALLDLKTANIDLWKDSAELTVDDFIGMMGEMTRQAKSQCQLGNNHEFRYLSPVQFLTWRKTDGTITGPVIKRTPSIPPSLPPPASEDVPSASRERSQVVLGG